MENDNGLDRQPGEEAHGNSAEGTSASHDGTSESVTPESIQAVIANTLGAVSAGGEGSGPIVGQWLSIFDQPGGLLPLSHYNHQAIQQIQAHQNAMLHHQMMQYAQTLTTTTTTAPYITSWGPTTGPVHVSFDYPETKMPESCITMGEITAWRAWRVRDGFVASVSADAVWEPGKPMEGKPEIGLGVHSWKTLGGVLSYANQTGATVIGRVALWGTVDEHVDGYRAEFARIVSFDKIISKKDDERMLQKLRATYGLTDILSKPPSLMWPTLSNIALFFLRPFKMTPWPIKILYGFCLSFAVAGWLSFLVEVCISL